VGLKWATPERLSNLAQQILQGWGAKQTSSCRRRLNGVAVKENYPEGVEIMTALRKGAALSSVRRAFAETKVSCERVRGSVEAEAEKG